MITIKIQRVNKVSRTEVKNFITKSTPTEITEESSSSYSNKREVKCIEEYATRDVTVWDTQTIDLLEQNIEDEEKFSLQNVIIAINGLGGRVG